MFEDISSRSKVSQSLGKKAWHVAKVFPAESSGCESPEAGHPHSPVSPLIGLPSGYD